MPRPPACAWTPLRAVLVALPLVTACQSRQPGEPPSAEQAGPVRHPVAALVHGTVAGPDGRPVADVQVVVTVIVTSTGGGERMGECTGSRGITVRTVTDASGAYRQKLDMGVGPQFTGCLVVEATPPESSELRPATESGATVPFVTDVPSTSLNDVRVDVTLPR